MLEQYVNNPWKSDKNQLSDKLKKGLCSGPPHVLKKIF